MKLLKSILILILMCVCTCAYAMEPGTYIIDGDPESYDIGAPKAIEVPNTFSIKYVTLPVENTKEVKLTGSIDVSRRYRVVDLTLDYYIVDGEDVVVRATPLNLTEVSTNHYEFTYQYPLDLANYSGEIFSLVFHVEILPQLEV